MCDCNKEKQRRRKENRFVLVLFHCSEERMAPPMLCSSSHGAGSVVAEAQVFAKS